MGNPPSDHDLLDRMKQLIKVTRRVQVKDAAAMLDLDHVTFLKRVMEWGKAIPFKIDGESIVVDDMERFTAAMDAQFSAWSGSEISKSGKIHTRTEVLSKPIDVKIREYVPLVEAILFVSGTAVSAREIAEKMGKDEILMNECAQILAREYSDRFTSLEIAKVADKYILQLKPEYTSSVKSNTTSGLMRESVMRTLTIIAVKQPISMSELVVLREDELTQIHEMIDDHAIELKERGLVTISIAKRRHGGDIEVLSTTDKFADTFGFSRDVTEMKDQIKVYLAAATREE